MKPRERRNVSEIYEQYDERPFQATIYLKIYRLQKGLSFGSIYAIPGRVFSVHLEVERTFSPAKRNPTSCLKVTEENWVYVL